MTQEELLGMSADELEKLTDEQLLEWATPFLHVTRPPIEVKKDVINEPKKSSTSRVSKTVNINKSVEAALRLAEQLKYKI